MKTLFPALTLLLLLSGCGGMKSMTTNTTDPLETFFVERKMQLLPNPATNFLPGTLLNNEEERWWQIACSQQNALPGIKDNVTVSPTGSFSVNINKNNKYEGNATLSNLASIAGEYADSIALSVKITNPEILSIEHSQLYGEVASPNCFQHLNAKGKAQKLPNLTMIMEAYRANIEVGIQFKDGMNMSSGAKSTLINKITKQLKGGDSEANVNIDNNSNSNAVLTGEKLIWAVSSSTKAATYYLNNILKPTPKMKF